MSPIVLSDSSMQAFADELARIEMEKAAFAPIRFAQKGLTQLGNIVRGGWKAGVRTPGRNIYGLGARQAAAKGAGKWGQRWAGGKAVARRFAPAAAVTGTAGLAGYGGYRALTG
jgi:hypothetical protein